MPDVLADLHCHVQMFGWQPFSRRRLQRFLKRARELGLKLLAITEHADAHGFWRIFEALENLNWQWEGMRVLPGTEITVREDGDLLVLGSPEALCKLESRPECWPTRRSRPSLARLLEAAWELDLMTIGAHPLRPGRDLSKLPHRLLKQLDALEVNGRELERVHEVSGFAAQLNLPLVGGSDAHLARHLGTVINEVPAWVEGVRNLRSAVRSRQTRVIIRRVDSLPDSTPLPYPCLRAPKP